MRKDLNNIEDLFKNSFENFEADVNPNVWNNVAQNIGNASAGTSAAGASSVLSKSVLFYAAAGIVATATIVGSVYLYNSSEDKKLPINENKEEVVKVVEEDTPILVELNFEEKESNSSALVEETPKETVAIVEKSTKENQIVSENDNEISTVQENEISASNSAEVQTVSNAINNKKENKSIAQVEEKVQPKELQVSIKSNVKKGKAPLDVEFGVNGEAVSYLWNFGDNTTFSSEETPFHTFKKPGTYKVTLTAIDKEANSKISYLIIEVESNNVSKVEEIQNVFSPNGDGINDVIKVEGVNIVDFHAVVMDAKGNLVYEWKALEGFWDGRDNNDNVLPKGTYYLVVTAKGKDGVKHIDKKSIQLY